MRVTPNLTRAHQGIVMLRCVISAIVLFCVAGGSASAQNERNLVWIRAAVGNKVTSEGTGFLVSKDGYVLTARTVVRGAYTDAGTKVEDAELSVAIVNRDSFPKRASVSYCEPYICILKINADEVAAHLSAIRSAKPSLPTAPGGGEIGGRVWYEDAVEGARRNRRWELGSAVSHCSANCSPYERWSGV